MTGFEPQTSGIEATALLTEPQLLPILAYLNTNKKCNKNFDRSFFLLIIVGWLTCRIVYFY